MEKSGRVLIGVFGAVSVATSCNMEQMGTINGEASMMFAPKFANNHIVPKGPCGHHIKLCN
ncbi:hypothetical protein GBA52_025020, partial [Prunus armeniaca]